MSLAALAAGLLVAQASGDVLTLGDAIALAQEQSPAVRDARYKLEVARTAQDEASSGWWPQVRLSSSAGQTNNFSTLLNPGATAPGSDQNLAALIGQTQNSFASGRLSVSQTLFDGRSWLGLDLARLDRGIASEQLRAARLEVKLGVQAAFLALIAARTQVAVQASSVAQVREVLSSVRSEARQGLTQELAVLQAEMRLASVEQEQWQAEHDAHKATVGLLTLLGRTPEQPLELVEPELPPRPVPGLEAAIAQALRDRPDQRIARLQREQDRLRQEQEARASWPSLAVSASGGGIWSGALGGASGNAVRPDLNLAGSLSWSLFDGWRSQARYERASLTVTQQDAARERQQQAMRTEVADLRAELVAAAARRELARRQLELAQRSLKLVQARLDQGLERPLRLLEARLEAARAAASARQALAACYLAQLRFEQALGLE